MVRDRSFEHTCVFDEELLTKTGMDNEFVTIFNTIGWSEFWRIMEPGSKLLTLEFLSTLEVTDTGIEFRMFNEEFVCSWRTLSNSLGFSKWCARDANECLPNFDRGTPNNHCRALCPGPHAPRGGRRFFNHDLQGLYNQSPAALHEAWVGLYAVKRLTLSLEEGRPPRPERSEPARHSVSGAGPTTRREPARHNVSGAGPTMRARTRRREETAEPSHPQPPPPKTSATAASQEAYSEGWHAGSYGSGYAEGAYEAGPSHQQFGANLGRTQSARYPPSQYEHFSHVVETTDNTNARVRRIEARLDEQKGLMSNFFGSWNP
ncbi:hypothetical protein C2845_PM15G01680 [Panicum miliaceum]|uniref:Uncharacterized protein n=1 Tax=Panicum miliaceum TaxID=4540 RepID=A0A3L6Q7V9_PANMI|nr:hypothetical protein C2845_PM15G01680 [Panicum miliaceum]